MGHPARPLGAAAQGLSATANGVGPALRGHREDGADGRGSAPGPRAGTDEPNQPN